MMSEPARVLSKAQTRAVRRFRTRARPTCSATGGKEERETGSSGSRAKAISMEYHVNIMDIKFTGPLVR